MFFASESRSVRANQMANSPELQAADVVVRQQFWLTVHVPDNTASGIYTSTISITAENASTQTISLEVDVPIFDLQQPNFEYSIYHATAPTSDLMRLNDFKNMVVHGCMNPNIYNAGVVDNAGVLDFTGFADLLSARELAGMEAAAGAIEADTWDDLLGNFTENALFCGAPGAVLLVDSPQGRFLEATGVSSLEDQTPMQVTDAFEIGSITKSFTAAVALQLQEEGVLSLDDSLAQWLPEMAAQVPNGEQMTLRQLANHTSGIWDYGDPILEAGATDTNLRQKTFSEERTSRMRASSSSK